MSEEKDKKTRKVNLKPEPPKILAKDTPIDLPALLEPDNTGKPVSTEYDAKNVLPSPSKPSPLLEPPLRPYSGGFNRDGFGDGDIPPVGSEPHYPDMTAPESVQTGLQTGTGMSEPEPPPIPNNQPMIWPLVVEDMEDRNLAGVEKYGVGLQAFNGRKPLKDAYQEILDLAVYIRQRIYEEENAYSFGGMLDAVGENITMWQSIWKGMSERTRLTVLLEGVANESITEEMLKSLIIKNGHKGKATSGEVKAWLIEFAFQIKAIKGTL